MGAETGLAERIEIIAAESWYRAAKAACEQARCARVEARGSARVFVFSLHDHGLFNRALGLGLDAPATEQELDLVLDAFREAGVEHFYLQVPEDAQPAELTSWLDQRDIKPSQLSWAKFVRGPEPAPEVDTDLHIRSLERSDAPAFARTACASFGLPQSCAPVVGPIVGSPGWHTYLAYDGDEPVACAAMFTCWLGAWMGFAGSLPGHRGRRAQPALLARRLKDGLDSGCQRFVMETSAAGQDSEISYHGIESSGFRLLYTRPNYVLSQAAAQS